MKFASIQMAVVEDDKTATIDKAIENIHRCEGFDLIILPEIWNIGFMSFDRYTAEAENRKGQMLIRLREAAKQIGCHLHTGSFVEEKNGKYYNSSYLIAPDGNILANYLKIHLFGYNSKEAQLLSGIVSQNGRTRGRNFSDLFGLAVSPAGALADAQQSARVGKPVFFDVVQFRWL